MSEQEKIKGIMIKFLNKDHVSLDFYNFIMEKVEELTKGFVKALASEGISEVPIGVFVNMFQAYLMTCGQCCKQMAVDGEARYRDLVGEKTGTVH